jgi:hypothetical protein
VQYDAIGPGHQFLRDPKTLRVYDPEEVRVDLQIHHRELETLNEASRRALQAEAERYEAKAAEGIRLVEALAESEQAHQRLLRQVESLEQQLVDVKESWSWRLTAPLRAIWGFLR